MTTISPSGKWRQRPLLFRFLATLYFLTISTGSLFSQTLNCDKTQCTSNDVRITSAYISGPANTPIDCGSSDPFNNAELHLIVSSNTQRVGASVVANLNITTTNTVIPISYCFSGQNLNNGDNNLSLPLQATLSGVQCPGGFTLSDQFISWGTGNTNFCTSFAGQCPATPSKCRYKPGEPIPVTVKLDVDFTFTPGVCNNGGNSLAVDFSPVITATNLTSPFTYSWDFGDGTSTSSLTVANLSDITDTIHTYSAAGDYTAKLIISDASSTVITKTGINSFTLTSCCNLSAPTVTAAPFCSADNKKVSDLPQTDGNGGTYHWYSGSDPNNSYELDPSTLLVNGTTYYVSVVVGTCESARTPVTIVVNQTPAAPTVGGPICAGSTTISGTSGEADGTTVTVYDGSTSIGTATVANGAWSATVKPAVAPGDVITATATSSGCSGTASTSVTVSANTDIPTVNSVCAGTTTLSGTNESGASVQVFVNGVPAGSATVTGTNWSKSISAPVIAGDTINAIATVSGECASALSPRSTVNPLPDCTITSPGSPTSATLGSPVTFSPATTGSAYTYAWGFSSNTSGASLSSTSGSSVTVTTSTVGSYTLTLTVTNTQTQCSSSSACNYRMTVTPAGPYYSVTQGFYGNIGGTVCIAGTHYTAGTKSSVPGLIEVSISNMPKDSLFLGNRISKMYFTMGNTAQEASNLIKYMPGGQTPTKLAGAYNITSALPPLYKSKISNVFLAQSITLALNLSIPGNSLAGFVLNRGYLTTQKVNSATCPSTTLLSCSASSTAISSLQITTNSALMNWMNGKTVQDLLNLASAVLGGTTPPAGVSIADINNAIDVINRSFDGGAAFLGYYPSQRSCSSNFNRDMTTATINPVESVTKLTISAYPNPFTNKVKFSVVSPVSGMASLDVYNIVGQKLKTVYQGYLQAGIKQIIEYNVTSPYKGTLIYSLKVGNQQVNGKVVQMK